MIMVLIHWCIKPQQVEIDAFLKFWKQTAIVEDRAGLIGEFLSEVSTKQEYEYITWDIGGDNINYKSFVNVGMWDDPDAFHEQIAKYFNDNKPLQSFESQRRRRTLLKPKCWRLGDSPLPVHDSGGVM